MKNISLVNFLALIIGTFTAIGAAAAAFQGAKTQENPDGGFPLLDFYNITIVIGVLVTLILSAKTVTTSVSHLLNFFNNLRKAPLSQEEQDLANAVDWLKRLRAKAEATHDSALASAYLGMGNLITYLLKRLQFCHITSKTLASSEGNVKISFFRKGEPKSDAEQEVHKNYTRWSACTDWI